MNNPDDMPIDDASIEELRKWLLDYKARTGKAWPILAKESGIAHGTITQFGPNYGGNKGNIAREIYKYRQKIEAQDAMTQRALARPKFIATRTASSFLSLLEIAHMGRVIVVATGPGTGKTMTVDEYRASMSNVWKITVRKSTSSVAALLGLIMKEMGLTDSRGWKHKQSDQVIEYVSKRNGLLIVDEAGNLTLEQMEELRAIHDATDMGLALFGNEELLLRIRGGDKRHAYARLNSRIANGHIQDVPFAEDVSAFLDAFEIEDSQIRKLLTNVARSPHNGGLREVKQILESANMLAIGDETTIALKHVEEAQGSRLTQHVRRAA